MSAYSWPWKSSVTVDPESSRKIASCKREGTFLCSRDRCKGPCLMLSKARNRSPFANENGKPQELPLANNVRTMSTGSSVCLPGRNPYCSTSRGSLNSCMSVTTSLRKTFCRTEQIAIGRQVFRVVGDLTLGISKIKMQIQSLIRSSVSSSEFNLASSKDFKIRKAFRGSEPTAPQPTPSRLGADLAFRAPFDKISRSIKSGTTIRCSPRAFSLRDRSLSCWTSGPLDSSPKSFVYSLRNSASHLVVSKVSSPLIRKA